MMLKMNIPLQASESQEPQDITGNLGKKSVRKDVMKCCSSRGVVASCRKLREAQVNVGATDAIGKFKRVCERDVR